MNAELESRELLTLCLKKIKGLNNLNVMDASFVWTEPHSRRIKVKLVVQKEVDEGITLQQSVVIEFVVQRNFCESCHRIEAKDYWNAVTQVRQKDVRHKKTFYYLEQLLLKNPSVRSKVTSIKSVSDGLDFFFDKRDDARKLADFLTTVVPSRYSTSERLVSHDTHSNTFNYKNTFSVEIVPICKDDVVCLPISLARSLGNIGQIVVVTRVTHSIYLVDPKTLKTAQVTTSMFFKTPFKSLGGTKQLTSFTVMDIEQHDSSRHQASDQHHILSDAWIVKTSEVGVNDSFIHVKTHLGHLLNVGDTVLGFDLKNSNVNDVNFEALLEKNDNVMDVILVKKFYGDPKERNKRRVWKLKRLQMNEEDKKKKSEDDEDFEDFVNDIEEDPVSRIGINIYKDKEKMAVDSDEQDDSVPRITLQEMLEDLVIDDDEDQWEDVPDQD